MQQPHPAAPPIRTLLSRTRNAPARCCVEEEDEEEAGEGPFRLVAVGVWEGGRVGEGRRLRHPAGGTRLAKEAVATERLLPI